MPESLELENGKEDVKTEKEKEQTFISDPESSTLSKSKGQEIINYYVHNRVYC